MAMSRKYENLPDLDDSAPDIYETPELVDDLSTRPTSTLDSEAGDDDMQDTEAEDGAINRRHINPDDARAQFDPSVRGRRVHDRSDGEMELVDEGIWRKIARLKREVEEAKAEITRRKEAHEGLDEDGMNDLEGAMSSLNTLESSHRVKDLLKKTVSPGHRAAVASDRPPSQPSADQPSKTPSQTYTVSYAPSYSSDHALARAATLDTRLAALEKSLGVDSLRLPTSDPSITNGALPITRPLLPTLSSLETQITTILSTSASSLEPASKRIRQLAEDAERLASARRAAREAAGDSAEHERSYNHRRRQEDPSGARGSPDPEEDSEQVAKLKALYGTLGTINSLAPILPGILERLRSLRLVHAEAGGAEARLKEVERRHAETAEDIRHWGEALEKVEKIVGGTEERMKGNVRTVEDWVKDLEKRMESITK